MTASVLTRPSEPERLLHKLRDLVSEAGELQTSGAEEAAIAARRAEIERLQLRLASVVKHNPLWDADWGRRSSINQAEPSFSPRKGTP